MGSTQRNDASRQWASSVLQTGQFKRESRLWSMQTKTRKANLFQLLGTIVAAGSMNVRMNVIRAGLSPLDNDRRKAPVAFGFFGIVFSRNRTGMPVGNVIEREQPAARPGRIVLTRVTDESPPSTGGS